MNYKEYEGPLYFIKMVALGKELDHKGEEQQIREIYYMSLAADQIAKWEPCLKLKPDPIEPDPVFKDYLKEKMGKKIDKTLSKPGKEAKL